MLTLFLSFLLIGGGGVTDDILGRLDRLERDNASLRGQVSALSVDTVRTSRSRRDAMSSADMNALLAPRSLGSPIGARGGRDTTPDLGSPLLSRLRDDATLPGYAAGRIESPYPNLLLDPLFETVNAPAALGTSFASVGMEWEAEYVQNSGASPGPTLGVSSARGPDRTGVQGFESSSMVDVDLIFPSAGDVTIYLRAATLWTPFSESMASWLTASLVVLSQGASANITTLSARVEIVDDLGTVVAQGDDADLLAGDGNLSPVTIETGLEGPVDTRTYQWRVRLDAASSGVGTITVQMANPLLAYSDDGSSPPFSPALGPYWTPFALVPLEFVQLNIPAATTANMPFTDNGAPAQIPVPWGGSIVGMSYRMDGTLSAGTLDIKAKVNGTAVWTAHALTSGSGADGTATQRVSADVFQPTDVLAVELVSSAGFLPTTRDIVVILWIAVRYDTE